MKKLLSLLLCIAMLACFCACDSGSDKDQTPDTTSTVTTAPATELKTEAATEATTEEKSSADTTAANTTKAGTTAANTTRKDSATTKASTTKPASTAAKTTSGKSSGSNSGSTKAPAKTTSALVTKVISAATSTFATVQNIFSPIDGKRPVIITNPNTSPAPTQSVTDPNGPAPTLPGTTADVPAPTTGTANVPGTTSNGQPTTANPPVNTTQITTAAPPVNKNSVITYPRASGLTLAAGYAMTANDVDVDLYSISANNNHNFSSNPKLSTVPVGMFEMTGPVTVKLTLPTAPKSAVVRPTADGVVPTVSGSTVTFTVTKAGYYSVELDGDEKNAVLLFIDEPHTAPSGNVTIKEAGLYDNVTINVEDGETLYLAPGAVVQGKILVKSNAKVCGRGIIDGSCFEGWLDSYARLPIELWEATNTDLEGFFILNPNAWAVQVQNSSKINISNVKVITSRPNGDGFSLQSSHDVTVTNCFLRTWDDTLVVKNYGLPASYNLTFTDCVLWNDLAQAMEIGYETNKGANANPVIHDIKFENITVLHGGSGAAVSIHNGDNAEIYDISYKNIIVEEFKQFSIIDMNNNFSGNWSKVKERGTIHDVTIDGLTLLDGRYGGKIDASQGAIKNVALKNVTFLGQKITSAADGKITLTSNPGVTFA